LAPRWMLTGEQHVEQYSQRIDVGCCGDCFAGQLFRRRIFRCQRSTALVSPVRRFVFKKFGNSEIKQLCLSIVPYQYIRGLEITVHDQVGMGLGYGLEYIKEQSNSRSDVEPLLVAIPVDVITINVLKHKVRLPSP